ncbi:MAG: hypothetical protein HFH91_04280 [Lachnospiraceae bacterium]|nr:hypothetical protein [Lachnospiraceae bacterium]
MTDIFLTIVNMSISAAWLVLAVLALRLLLKRAPRWISVLLWGIVAVRLVCPFFPESPVSLIPNPETIRPGISTDDSPSLDTGISALDAVVNPMFTGAFAPGRGDSANPLQIWIPILSAVWSLGMAGILGYTAVCCLRLRRRLSTAVLLRDNLFQSEYAVSPFVFGIIRPRIYLPYRMDEGDFAYVAAHEQAHIRRHDHWWKLLGIVLLAFHWFNPLLWLAYTLLCRDIEGACDEKVIREFDREQRAGYSQALLSNSAGRRRAAACPLAFGEVGVKERVKSVLNYRKPAFWTILAAGVICAVLAACFLTDPEKDRYAIRITIPAGSPGGTYYSDEEISPRKREVRFEVGQDIGDTQISLDPVEVEEENAYDEPAYATPGFVSAMQAEKGGWFRVGIYADNPTDQDRDVYVTVSPVDVRIASGVAYAERPMLLVNGEYYVDPYMPVSDLPKGYRRKGVLSEEEAYNTELAGEEYFVNPDEPDDFYVYQECGTSIGPNIVDTEQRQRAYVRWIRVGSEN